VSVTEAQSISAIHLDAVGGVAGDMFCAALLDARPDLWAACAGALDAMKLPKGVSANLESGSDAGFAGARFQVELPTPDNKTSSDHVHWAHIRQTLSQASLNAPVRDMATAIFTILAEAEAAVHGIDVDGVAFHEVGAIDSIVDIVTAAALIDALGPCQWSVGPLPRGRGQVKSQHGFLPLPAPATAQILQGFQLIDDGEDGERVTPTGAAIMKYLNPSQAPDPTPRTLLGIGTGLGTKKLKSRANMLRATLYSAADAGLSSDTVEVLRCEIDDQTGEDLAAAVDRLRATEGVLDVCQWPVFGKKGRVATALQVLARPPQSEMIIVEMLNETQTLGVRRVPQTRRVVERHDTVIDGVRVKLAKRPGGLTAKVEMDDISGEATAQARGAMKRRVEAAALAEAENNVD